MPRYEVRRKVEEVVTVEADDPADALEAAKQADDEDWAPVSDEHVSTVELVRCHACGCEVEIDWATRLPDGRWQGNPYECGCGI